MSKYHFRRYRKSLGHPFLVALVTETRDQDGKTLLSGFNMTRSVNYVMSRPNKFVRINNPNPEDDAECFLCIDAIKDKPLKLFSKPIVNWEVSLEDEQTIDLLVARKITKD